MEPNLLISVIAAFASTTSIAFYRHFVEDRTPWLTRTLTALAACGILFLAGWALVAEPILFFVLLAAFVALNLLDGFASTSTRFKFEPAHLHVWDQPTMELRTLGWVHVGTWRLEIAGKYPELTVFDRADGKARVLAIGTAPQGGIVEVETHLGGGAGLLNTINKRSRLIRPPWQFKQTFRNATISELVRHHEGAMGYLEVMGAAPAPFPPEHPIATMRTEHLAIRDFFKRRWWLVAIQPMINYLTPSRARPIHEQSDIERQIERYRSAPAPALFES